MAWPAALLSCYLLGSIPTAYILTKCTKGIDIRTVGSGNVGATNAGRILGWRAGAAVFVVDLLKGVVAAWVVPTWLLGFTTPDAGMACGSAAVLGHNFPCFLQFRGGKGVATTLGVLLGSIPACAGVVILVWVVVFLASRYISLASLAAAVAIPISQLVCRQSLYAILIGSLLALLMIVRHRTNIQRLLSGIEHRAGSH
ncbi:MAG: glycerol-3-phosphate 1-O-acyltransferase PlsY [Candidatus Omnitrophica bacterium]|nr:glycerol-3-phosphate 1-O-acyltransferase PlsY [Candidatus Omnitrophota bacterium]